MDYDNWKTSEIDIPSPREEEEKDYDHEAMSLTMLLMRCKKEAMEETIDKEKAK